MNTVFALPRSQPYLINLAEQKVNIEHNVFIPLGLTNKIASMVEQEYWGEKNILLYKYLDYTWRIQLINQSAQIFIDDNNITRLIINTGLKFRAKNKGIAYLILVPNHKSNIPWKISDGYKFLASKKYIMKKYNINYLPKKNYFHKNIKDFNFCKRYQIKINFEEFCRNVAFRVSKSFNIPINYSNFEWFKHILNESINNSIENIKKNCNIVGTQVYIERYFVKNDRSITKGFHLQMLFPIEINIFDIKKTYAMVVEMDHENEIYQGMSLITIDKAYANSRLIKKNTLQWLKYYENNDNNEIFDNSSLFLLTAFPETCTKFIKDVSLKY